MASAAVARQNSHGSPTRDSPSLRSHSPSPSRVILTKSMMAKPSGAAATEWPPKPGSQAKKDVDPSLSRAMNEQAAANRLNQGDGGAESPMNFYKRALEKTVQDSFPPSNKYETRRQREVRLAAESAERAVREAEERQIREEEQRLEAERLAEERRKADELEKLSAFKKYRRDDPNGQDRHRKNEPPSIELAPTAVEVEEGGAARFMIRVTGWPLPRVQWKVNGSVCANSKRFKVRQEGKSYTMEILKVHSYDDGVINVNIGNAYGECECTSTLTVKAASNNEWRPGLRKLPQAMAAKPPPDRKAMKVPEVEQHALTPQCLRDVEKRMKQKNRSRSAEPEVKKCRDSLNKTGMFDPDDGQFQTDSSLTMGFRRRVRSRSRSRSPDPMHHMPIDRRIALLEQEKEYDVPPLPINLGPTGFAAQMAQMKSDSADGLRERMALQHVSPFQMQQNMQRGLQDMTDELNQRMSQGLSHVSPFTQMQTHNTSQKSNDEIVATSAGLTHMQPTHVQPEMTKRHQNEGSDETSFMDTRNYETIQQNNVPAFVLNVTDVDLGKMDAEWAHSSVDWRCPPCIDLMPESVNCHVGDTVKLMIKVKGYPQPRLTWTINDHEIGTTSQYRPNFDGMMHSLEIANVHERDAGIIKAYAYNIIGEIDCCCQLNVESLANWKDGLKQIARLVVSKMRKPPKSLQPRLWDVKELLPSERIHLDAASEKNIADHLNPLTHKDLSEDERDLIFQAMERADEDTDDVVPALDEKGQPVIGQNGEIVMKSAEKKPVTEGPPQFGSLPKPVLCEEGDTAKFILRIGGNPPPRVVWTHKEEPIGSDPRIKLTQARFKGGMMHMLEIKDAQFIDTGLIRVYAKNAIGKVMCSVSLVVIKQEE